VPEPLPTLTPNDHSEPLRVLHIVSGDLWGGAEAFVFDLAVAQRRQGRVAPACIVLNEGLLAEALRGAGIPVTVLDESRNGFLSLFGAASSVVRSVRPAIIHSHRAKEHLLAGLLAARSPGGGDRPMVISTIHGSREFRRRFWDLRGRVADGIERAALGYGCSAIVSVSEELVEYIGRLVPKARPVVIRNGVDVDRVERHARKPIPPGLLPERRSGEIRLVAVGRLVPIKRFDRLAPLAAQLAHILGRPVTILLAGDGALREALEREFAGDHGDGRVVMLGFQAPVEPIIASADGLVMTSDHEGLPIVALESTVLGRPVFAFAVGGLVEIVGALVPGALAPVGDTAALAEAIMRALEAPAPSPEAGRLTRSELSIQTCSSRYEQLYFEVIASGSTPRLRCEAASERRVQ
jgi:L-malate glycosyltransferase